MPICFVVLQSQEVPDVSDSLWHVGESRNWSGNHDYVGVDTFEIFKITNVAFFVPLFL